MFGLCRLEHPYPPIERYVCMYDIITTYIYVIQSMNNYWSYIIIIDFNLNNLNKR
jgi:hypothetical protein